MTTKQSQHTDPGCVLVDSRRNINISEIAYRAKFDSSTSNGVSA